MSNQDNIDSIDLYADDIEQDFNTDEFAAEGVDLYDDVITTTSGRRDSEGGDQQGSNDRPTTPNNIVTSPVSSKSNSAGSNQDHLRDREYIQPLRKHQVYIGNLTWWTSDRDIQETLNDIGVHDFVEVKFYENRANGQSKGYCVLTVGSDVSLKIIKDKFCKKEIHGQIPVVTPPTKQALNQFEAQSKTRPTPGPGGPNSSGGGGGGSGGGGGGGNMNNMMGGPGPRGGPMGGPQMGGYGGMNRMGSPIRPPRGMGPPPGHRNMGPPNHQNSPGGGQFSQRMGPPMGGPGGPHQSNHSGHPLPPGPPQRFPPPFQGGPRGPPMPHNMDHQRGPPPPRQGDWNRPPMNPYPPQQAPGLPPPGPIPPQVRGLPPQGIMTGPPPQGAPAPHMNPAFFNPQGPPAGPPQGPPPPAYNNSPRAPPGPQYPPVEHHEASTMSEAEFEEIMGRNRTVSRSAISRAVTDAASGEFASAIETLVTAISLIKQSKVAPDDRCKILISSLQDTLHGIEAKSYGRRERSRSRERERHRRRRDRSRSRERDYRDRSRERYYEYGERSRERSRSREREYARERAGGGAGREEGGSSRYYEDRYRERERSERDRPQLRPPSERDGRLSERESRSRRSIPESGPDQERSKYS